MQPPLSSATHDPHKDSWYPYSNGPHFDSNIAMILIFVFCALICALALNAGIRFFLRLSRQDPRDQEQQTDVKQAQSPTPSLLLSLPTLVFSSGTKMKLAGGGAECAICLSEFVEGEAVRILPKCKHGFHVKCIQGWLSSQLSCPTCRATCLTPPPSPPHKTGDHYDVESPPPPPLPLLQTPGGDQQQQQQQSSEN